MDKIKEIEALIKEELEELKECCAYGTYSNKRNDEQFLYSIRGIGYFISFYECREFRRVAAGAEWYFYTKYELYGFINFVDNLKELMVIDKIKTKLDGYVERRAKNNENNYKRN